MEVLLAQPRGFCAGVDRAIEIVERALQVHGAPIYVRHEIVHNTHEAQARGLRVFDATCPLVTKVHVEVERMRAQGREVVMIGHAGHEGTMGQADGGIHLIESPEDVARLQVRDPDCLGYVTQTTLSIDDAAQVVAALKGRFPNIAAPKKADICYATQNRQDAVKVMAPQVDLVIVIGSRTSSNSNRLREVAERFGVPARLVDSGDDVDPAWLQGRRRIGVTAGASAPESLVQALIDRLRSLGASRVRVLEGVEEHVVFPLPKGLGRTTVAEPLGNTQ
ncbi:MAG: ispH [Burkholderiaceae bacterium]|nr:ispH [Burkholderiaceae bacterium]